LTDYRRISKNTSEKCIPKPQLLNKMLELSKILSADIPNVRVDWYLSGNKLYFGELTFFNGSGFIPFPNGQDEKLGKQLILPKI
jgi:hypothetical protein